jgi:tRNA pseudouridine38-40 synthase
LPKEQTLKSRKLTSCWQNSTNLPEATLRFMARIALGISYNGATYHGWQYQNPDLATVQDEVQKALSIVADHPVTVTCAGRTDSGVHATSQIVHFNSESPRELKSWISGVNANLPDSVSVNWSRAVVPEFDARHAATSRRYLYLIYNARIRSALMPELLTKEHRVLDVNAMNESARALLGVNDFSSYRAASCQSLTPIRNIHNIEIRRIGELVLVDISANAFLHHMVRNIVGVLMDIGSGEKPISWVADLLGLKDRTKAGVTAPPNGLYLIQVDYPDKFGLPKGPCLPHFLGALPLA